MLAVLLAPRTPAQMLPGGIQSERKALQTRESQGASLLIREMAQPDESQDIDALYYRLVLSIDTPPATPRLHGALTMTARSLSDSLTAITLDLSGTMLVDSVLLGPQRAGVHRTGSLLRIDLDRRYRAGETVILTVYYGGLPQSSGFGSFAATTHGAPPGVAWVWTLSEPYGARDWWPCKDHPSDKADSVDVIVTCDARLKVGSNGLLLSVTDNHDGTRTHHWAERYPIATYLVSVAISDFAEVTDWFHFAPADSMPVLNYVLPEQLPAVRDNLRLTLAMLGIFSDLYGLYPFIREKYGHASFGWGGAMEHQTMTSTTGYDEYLIAHELAHQWFGDMITMRSWRDIWLNEGFATYSEALYAERAYGEQSYRGYMASILDGARRATGSVHVEDTSTVRTLFDGALVYDKGASVLHMLRHVLGDSVFFRAMKAYASDPALQYRTASTADFQEACERVSGRSLAYFFTEWIYGEGYPHYTYGWTTKTGGMGSATVTLRLTQSGNTAAGPAAFTMPLDVRCSAVGWDTTVVVMNSTVDQTFTFSLSRQPERVVLDPDAWVLKEAINANDAPAVPLAYALGQNYPNPFNPGTTIPYEVPVRSHVTLKIFAVTGQEIATLVDEQKWAGRYEVTWDRTTASGGPAASGVYFYRLSGNGFTATRKMLLVH